MRKPASLRQRLHFGAAISLVIGLAGSVWIYVTAELPGDVDLITDYEGSKMYRLSLEQYGGHFNVMADEFRRWLVGLWQGRQLAYTVAVLAVLVAGLLIFIASDPHLKDR